MKGSMKPIPWFEPSFDEADAEAVKQVVKNGFVNEGPGTRALEQELCEYFGVEFAITFPNCTTAIALSLMALGVGAGDTVLVPDITFIGTASAVRLARAEPILVDIDPLTFTIDPDDAKRRLQISTKAIIPVHLNGRSADLTALRGLAQEKALLVIEDAAEALGSRNKEGYLGTLSEAGCFSLAPTKIITSGQGGFVLTNCQDMRDNLVRLKDHGRTSRSSDEHPQTGFNFKFTDLQAGLAFSQLKKLDTRIKRSIAIDKRYKKGLCDIKEIEFPPRPCQGGYLMWPDFKSSKRDQLVQHLKERHHISLRPFWPPLHMQPAYKSTATYHGATEASRNGCWLPCSPGITDEQIERVITTVRAFFCMAQL